MILHTQEISGGPKRVVYLHGVFGQGRNFTQIAKATRDIATSLLIDLPNHGRSPWSETIDYGQMAYAVSEALNDWGAHVAPVTLIGHSMGGKVAMRLALENPALLRQLIVVDISPRISPINQQLGSYIEGLLQLPLAELPTRTSVDKAAKEFIPNQAIRSTLLQNLHHKTDGSWTWRANLQLLHDHLDQVAAWPPIYTDWDGPVCWIRGELSEYVQEADIAPMEELFPAVELKTVPKAGHWVHVEQPAAFLAQIRSCLSRL